MVAWARLTVARWLEEGALDGPLSLALGQVHAALARRAIARPLRLPTGGPGRPPLVTITVGGATLGGSGKTRLALACARELAARGAEVALLGHAYRGALRGARVVSVDDPLTAVGDEALLCARALGRQDRARVVVGPTRRAALALALALRPAVDVLVLDGPLQLAPARSSLSVLALDAAAPWGSGALPPAGDLRAPREALLSAADVVVAVEATPRAALLDGETVALGSLPRAGPLGLFTALARPERLERALASAGIVPAAVVRAADHGPVTRAQARRLGEAPVALWLATDKCALHLDALRLGLRLRVARLDGGLALPPALLEALARAWDTPPHRLP